MRRQPPIVRCFVLLCFSTAVTLAAFEWRNPFPDPVITLDAAPNISPDAVLNLGKRRAGDEIAGVGLASEVGNLRASGSGQSNRRSHNILHWLPFGHAQRADAIAPENSVELVLSLEKRLLEVRVPGETPLLYEVAVGHDDWQTPVGEFTIMSKLENPAWQHPITQERIEPGPDNPLGDRWIGFWTDGQAQIGFHGTNQEELIGEAVSHGCVRMRNQDIQALYAQVEVGTRVTVKP